MTNDDWMDDPPKKLEEVIKPSFPCKTLGVLLLRKGSTRLPGKNWMSFNECPLWEWVFYKMVKCIDKVVVSSDNLEIKDKVLEAGADFYERPEHLRGSDVSSADAVLDAIKAYPIGDKREPGYQIVVLCQVTTPNLTNKTLCKTIDALHGYPACITVNKYTLQPNGGVYAIWRNVLEEKKSFYVPNMGIVKLSPEESCDIDFLHQFYIAEAVKRKRMIDG